jgi:hypothetical protein
MSETFVPFSGVGHRLLNPAPEAPILTAEQIFNPLAGTFISALYKKNFLNNTLGKHFYTKIDQGALGYHRAVRVMGVVGFIVISPLSLIVESVARLAIAPFACMYKQAIDKNFESRFLCQSFFLCGSAISTPVLALFDLVLKEKKDHEPQVKLYGAYQKLEEAFKEKVLNPEDLSVIKRKKKYFRQAKAMVQLIPKETVKHAITWCGDTALLLALMAFSEENCFTGLTEIQQENFYQKLIRNDKNAPGIDVFFEIYASLKNTKDFKRQMIALDAFHNERIGQLKESVVVNRIKEEVSKCEELLPCVQEVIPGFSLERP